MNSIIDCNDMNVGQPYQHRMSSILVHRYAILKGVTPPPGRTSITGDDNPAAVTFEDKTSDNRHETSVENTSHMGAGPSQHYNNILRRSTPKPGKTSINSEILDHVASTFGNDERDRYQADAKKMAAISPSKYNILRRSTPKPGKSSIHNENLEVVTSHHDDQHDEDRNMAEGNGINSDKYNILKGSTPPPSKTSISSENLDMVTSHMNDNHQYHGINSDKYEILQGSTPPPGTIGISSENLDMVTPLVNGNNQLHQMENIDDNGINSSKYNILKGSTPPPGTISISSANLDMVTSHVNGKNQLHRIENIHHTSTGMASDIHNIFNGCTPPHGKSSTSSANLVVPTPAPS